MTTWHWVTVIVFVLAVILGVATNDPTDVGPSQALVDWTEGIATVAALMVAIFGMLEAVPSFTQSLQQKRRADLLRAVAQAKTADVVDDNIRSIVNDGKLG